MGSRHFPKVAALLLTTVNACADFGPKPSAVVVGVKTKVDSGSANDAVLSDFSSSAFQGLTQAQISESLQAYAEWIEDPRKLVERIEGDEGCVVFPKAYRAEAPG